MSGSTGGGTGDRVTIVMYHYVRDLAGSDYPRIKGLTPERFELQLDYIERFYEVIRMEDLLRALDGAAVLPRNALLLTFDDGFIDHYETVTPMLAARGWQGSFFPCTMPLAEGRVLDVHKLHFILASVNEPSRLLGELDELLRETAAGHPGAPLTRPDPEEVHRYDDAAVTAFKRALQRDLPPTVREPIVDRLFRRYVTDDEVAFARGLYASADQLREMCARGMYLGCHGHSHVWLNRLSLTDAGAEIEQSLAVWDRLAFPMTEWVMCYPYGGYDDTLDPMLRRSGCVAGLLAEPEIADVSSDIRFMLPRLDTNDLPQAPAAEPNTWTRRVHDAI